MSLKVKSNGINFNVPTIENLPTERLEEGLVCVVTDENRGGVFVYREANALVNNGGTIFNGWTRQYYDAVNRSWFEDETSWNSFLLSDTTIAANAEVRSLSKLRQDNEVEINHVKIRLNTLGTYIDNASAIAGGLITNQIYKTPTGELRIVV